MNCTPRLKTIFVSLFSFSIFFCQSAPQQISKDKITNPAMQQELREYEREIVKLNYDIEAQLRREEEFAQNHQEWQDKYKAANQEQQKKLKADLDLSELKAKLEKTRRELLQLQLKERIAHLELKKATMFSAESPQPLELGPYEEYHKSTAKDVQNKKEQLRKVESEYNELLNTTENTQGGSL